MKKVVKFGGLAVVLALFLLTDFVNTSQSLKAEEVRFLSYNIRNGKGMDDVTDLDRIATVIKKVDPQFAAIQELDRKTTRSGQKDVLQELALRTGLIGTYGKAIDFQGGEYGVGILSKEKPRAVRTVRLPGREEPRILLIAEFEKCCFACTHFSLNSEDRLASARIIAKELNNQKLPVFIAGDFNAQPGSLPVLEMLKSWHQLSENTCSWPADKPNVCIDYFFARYDTEQLADSPDWWKARIKERKVIENKEASDHRPLLLIFELP